MWTVVPTKSAGSIQIEPSNPLIIRRLIARPKPRPEVTPGSTVVFPKGWAGTWHVVEAMKKIYFIVA